MPAFPLSDSAQRAPLLTLRDLAVGFDTDRGLLRAVDGVSFDVPRGKMVGVVGESGCGKSVTAFSIMQLLPRPYGKILGGQILFEGRDLARATPEEMRAVRAARIGMVFQEPLSALNPVHTIGRQISEVFLEHKTKDRREALQLSVEMLRQVGIPSPELRAGEYPHQLSGGMRQRVVIAMALACQPALLIADEPTTALDVTIQAQILELIRELQHKLGMAVLLITHDLGVIAENCDEVVVMYAGRVAERGSVEQIFDRPAHPYTRGLLASIPRLESERKSRLATIEGLVPGLHEMPAGCRFQNRCPLAADICRATQPPLEEITSGHTAACLRWRDQPTAKT
jgi:oligopeptide/dipeptide ABC transporter ATP-binding protein